MLETFIVFLPDIERRVDQSKSANKTSCLIPNSLIIFLLTTPNSTSFFLPKLSVRPSENTSDFVGLDFKFEMPIRYKIDIIIPFK